MKCQVCDKEVDLPFRCSYCQGYFCIDHKLPENHQCPDLPKEPLFWYLKKQKFAELTERGRSNCPKCGSAFVGALSFDKEKENLRCQMCGYEWRQLRVLKKEEMETIELKPKKQKVRHRRKLRKTLRNVKTIGVFVISLIIVGIFIFSWINFFSQLIMPHTVDTTQVGTKIFQQINEERTNRGLPVLLNDEALGTIALEWSTYLAETGNLTHGDFGVRIASIGYSQYECGEIIGMYGGWTSTLGRAFVDMWLGSHGHREIMLTPLGGYMGVGVSKGVKGFFAVVDFRFIE